jgi:vitamin B12 transporter
VLSDRSSLAGAFGWQRSTGIDSFGAPGGDKDGYKNLSGRVRGTYVVAPGVRIGAAGFAFTGQAQFDGYDPLTFEHTDTLDNTRNRLAAARVWAEFGDTSSAWSGRVGASLLGSSNRNYLARAPLNRTSGSRRTIDAQIQRRFATGSLEQQLILAAEEEGESFHARGLSSGLSTDQDRRRSHQALSAEWRGSVGALIGDVAVRRDFFDKFDDATTLRTGIIANLGDGFALAGSYAEGMAQPTFFDLYGTFPNNFIGNPNLRPETSQGFEASVRFRRSNFNASLTVYRQRLHHEIVDIFNLTTFLASTDNSAGVSHRSGVEASIGWQVMPALRLSSNYAYVDATQPDTVSGLPVRERRRPKHSGAVEADGTKGRWSYGASIAYAGAHLDTLEVAPFGAVRVKPYWLANARIGYAVDPRVELFVRGSNLFNANYQEVAGYHTERIGGFVGVSWRADRRSSP